MYKPADSYYKEFITSSPSTGAAANADSLPVATANHNGTDDGAFTLTVTNIDTGRYKITGTVPAYSSGDVVNISIAATCSSIAGKAIVDTFTIDAERVSDVYARLGAPSGASIAADIQTRSTYAGGAVASVTAPVSIPVSVPSGYATSANQTTINSNVSAVGSAVVALGSPMQAGATVNATLVSTGLDAISTTIPSGPASTFTGRMNQVWNRLFGKTVKATTSGTAGTIKTYAADGTTLLTTQTYADDGAGNQSQTIAS